MTDEELKILLLNTLAFKGNIDFKNETDEVAKQINFSFENLVKQALSKYRWGFAINTVELTERTDIINYKFKYSYKLPKDFLVLINPYNNSKRNGIIRDYEIKKYYFATNSDKVYITYNSRIDTEEFPDYFIQYIKYKLALEFCYNLTGDTDLLQILTIQENKEFIIAKNIDAKQQPTRVIKDSPYLYARY